MTDGLELTTELRELLDEVAARSARLSAVGWPAEDRGSVRRAEFLRDAERHLLDVHRQELAAHLFVEAQRVLGRAAALEHGVCGLRSDADLEREAERRRARLSRAAEIHGGALPDAPRAVATPGGRAARLLERSLELVPDGMTLAALALVLAAGGDPRRALRLLGEGPAGATPRAVSRRLEAEACALDRTGRPADAARAYDGAADRDPTNAGAVLFSLYFALEHGDRRALDRAAGRVRDLPVLSAEGRDVIAVQRRSLAAGDWRPSATCLERARLLRASASPQLDHALEVLHR